MKTYTAASMADALAQVKSDLGSDAVILHTRKVRRGGILGLGARTVVEVIASDGREVGRRRRAARQKPVSTPRPARRPPASRESAGDLIRRTYEVACQEAARQSDDGAGPSVAVASSGLQAEGLANEMKSLRQLVGRMIHRQAVSGQDGAAALPRSDDLFNEYVELLNHEVAEELALKVVDEARTDLANRAGDGDARVQEALLAATAKLIPTDQGAGRLDPTEDGRPRVVALIGPTGVGKTTTVAKLAANFKLKQKRRVRLITVDTYRIAAVDQLQTYANIIGVPLTVVTTPQQMEQALADCQGSELVLIDTAGRGQRDDPKLEQLAGLIRAAQPHEVHLVLSSTCSQQVLLDTIERFDRIQTDRIIFTKLDEAVSFGVLLNVARQVNKLLSYVTTGQEVPHEIEPSRPDRLAALLLGRERIDTATAMAKGAWPC
ncbi:MAG: flagellar biosynthesis protein FlhF [Phycisphaeraceae bacterium]|nr:flagellar biosynthesis protein FlhF [Phycisphaeraceae bacterium]